MKMWLWCLLLCSCAFASEFDQKMGQGTAAWAYVETREDHNRIAFFRQLYDTATAKTAQVRIPTTLHFIWLGPKPYPTKSLQRLHQWVALHPQWTIKFWTDQEHLKLPFPVQTLSFQHFPLEELTECYFQCDNFGERSELLRLCILRSEGGFYIDHDLVPLHSLNAWQESADFVCGLEPLQPSVMSSSVIVGTSFLGSIPHHPFLEKGTQWLSQEWPLLEARYPGQTPDALYNRVMHRSKRALDQGIQAAPLDSPLRNWVLPFSQLAQDALHLHEQSWLHKHNPEEGKLKSLIHTLSSRVDALSLLLYGLGALNLLAGGALFFIIKKRVRTT